MKNVFVPLLFCCIAAGNAQSETDPKSGFAALIYDPPPVDHMQPLDHPAFSELEVELKHLIFMHGDTAATNHFCVVGYQFENGNQEALVVWSEPNQLIRWHGHSDPALAKEGFQYANSLAFSEALPLESRSADTPPDNSETTAISPAEADAVLKNCREYGKHYTIGPFTPPADE